MDGMIPDVEGFFSLARPRGLRPVSSILARKTVSDIVHVDRFVRVIWKLR